jgi:hypothetical protein
LFDPGIEERIGPYHQRAHSQLKLPTKLLCAGEARVVASGRLGQPFLIGSAEAAHPRGWHEAANDNTKIVPGHGALATKANLEEYRDMLVTARDPHPQIARRGQDRGTSPGREAAGRSRREMGPTPTETVRSPRRGRTPMNPSIPPRITASISALIPSR